MFSGNVGLLTENIKENRMEHLSKVSENMDLSTEDFYKELRLRGYQYEDAFLGFINANGEGKTLGGLESFDLIEAGFCSDSIEE